jgi:hypothetical protein
MFDMQSARGDGQRVKYSLASTLVKFSLVYRGRYLFIMGKDSNAKLFALVLITRRRTINVCYLWRGVKTWLRRSRIFCVYITTSGNVNSVSVGALVL